MNLMHRTLLAGVGLVALAACGTEPARDRSPPPPPPRPPAAQPPPGDKGARRGRARQRGAPVNNVADRAPPGA